MTKQPMTTDQSPSPSLRKRLEEALEIPATEPTARPPEGRVRRAIAWAKKHALVVMGALGGCLAWVELQDHKLRAELETMAAAQAELTASFQSSAIHLRHWAETTLTLLEWRQRRTNDWAALDGTGSRDPAIPRTAPHALATLLERREVLLKEMRATPQLGGAISQVRSTFRGLDDRCDQLERLWERCWRDVNSWDVELRSRWMTDLRAESVGPEDGSAEFEGKIRRRHLFIRYMAGDELSDKEVEDLRRYPNLPVSKLAPLYDALKRETVHCIQWQKSEVRRALSLIPIAGEWASGGIGRLTRSRAITK